MSEREPIKVNLSTVFLAIALIVIMIMAYYIYTEKTTTDMEKAELNEKATSMQNTINDLQNKIDTISNTINSNVIEKDKDINSKNENTISSNKIVFSDKQIKKCLQEYLELTGIREGSPSGLLVKLDLLDKDDISYVDDNATSDGYIKTNIKYSEYKNAMMDYMTEDLFNDKFTNGFKQKDGLLYYFNGGATGTSTKVDDITLKGDYSDSTYIANVYDVNIDGSKIEYKLEFSIVDYKGKCVISYCD